MESLEGGHSELSCTLPQSSAPWLPAAPTTPSRNTPFMQTHLQHPKRQPLPFLELRAGDYDLETLWRVSAHQLRSW